MRFNKDERGLAVNIGIFFATLIIAALLYFVLQPPAEMMLGMAENQTTREASHQGQAYVSYAWSNSHLIAVGFGVIQLVVAAVWESRLGGVR